MRPIPARNLRNLAKNISIIIDIMNEGDLLIVFTKYNQ